MTLVERNRPIVLGVYKQRKSGAGAQSPPLKLLIHREPADANGGHSGPSRQALGHGGWKFGKCNTGRQQSVIRGDLAGHGLGHYKAIRDTATDVLVTCV
jgi:hypothetical protein